MTAHSSYKNIFRTTFLFSFVKVFQIIVSIIRNKVIAILLGAEGVGLIGIYANTINLIKTGAGIGISQSAVRDISEANSNKNKLKFSKIISVTNKVILYSGALGLLITTFLSPFLSKWTLGDNSHVVKYIWLGLVVGLNIFNEGQFAILKGMRQLKQLAYANMFGAFLGLIAALPLYYFLGMNGIVPSLIVLAFINVFFSNYYVRKVEYIKTAFSPSQLYKEASPMAKMGIALMIVDFLTLAFELVIISYLRKNGGLEIAGYYRAGTTIITAYFGIIITAMTTDYYPRISAVHSKNNILKAELNKQTRVGLLIIFPLSLLFAFFAPSIFNILYSTEFHVTSKFTDWAILGIIASILSNSIGMILIAKQVPKIFITFSFSIRILLVPIYFVLFQSYGLYGLGIAYACNIALQLIVLSFIIHKKYRIGFNTKNWMFFTIITLNTYFVTQLRDIEYDWIKYPLFIIVFFASCFYSIFSIKKYMD